MEADDQAVEGKGEEGLEEEEDAGTREAIGMIVGMLPAN